MEDQNITSSQESLPFSQETWDCLLNMIKQDESLMTNINAQDLVFDAPAPPVQPIVSMMRSSLPATGDWPGEVGFNVTFSEQPDKGANNVNWVFVERDRKLFVKKDSPCPINFSTGCPLLPGATVRAEAFYTSPVYASESVHRCVQDSKKEIEEGVFHAEHLVRSESSSALYYQNEEKKQHSVVVPFENPPVGQCFSTYIYKFACWSSCPGGPNRRPLTLVFTLELNGFVIGRRSISLKICACPGRDSGTIVKAPTPKTGCSTKPTVQLPAKRKATVPKPESAENYVLRTDNLECYQFLRGMKRMYKINKKVSGLPREYYKVFFQLLMSSSSEDEEYGPHN